MKSHAPHNPGELRRQAEERLSKKQSGQMSGVGGQRTPEDCASLSPDEIRATLHELRVHQIELEIQSEELRRAQAEIEAGRARYSDLYDLAPVGYCTLSEQGLILEINLTAANLLGTARGALVKQPFSRFIVKEDQDVYYLHRGNLFAAPATDSGQTRAVQEFELRLVKPDGTCFWAHLTATAAQADDGAPLCRVALINLTARKQMEQALQQSEERFRTLTTLAPTGIYLTDPQGQCLYANPRWCEMAGMPLSSVLGSGWIQGLHPEDRDVVLSAWARMVATEGQWGREYRFRTPEGKVSWVYGLATTVRDQKGKTISYVGVNTDITERKQAEVALLEREEELRSIASSIPGAIYQFVRRVDGTFEIPFMSEGARLLFDRPVAELQDPAHLFDDVHPEDVPGLWASIAASAKDLTPWSTEFRVVPKAAPLRWLRGASNPRRIPDGGTSWYGVLLDITEEKRGEEQTRLQHTLALALAAASDLQQGLRLCLETARQGSGLDAGGFYLVEESSGALDFLVPHGLSSEFVQAVSRYEAASDHTRLVMAGSPVYARLEDLGLSLSEAERREGLRFAASIPLHYAGKVIGSMNVASHAADDIPPATRQALETIAATATQAIVRLRAQERLRASEALLNQTQRLSKVGGWDWDTGRQRMVWTEETYRLHDLSPQDFAPGSDEHVRRSAACYGPEHQAAILEAFRRCAERGEAYDLEVPFTSVKGRSMWVRTIAQAVWEGNRIVKVVGNLMDITERKEREVRMALLVHMLDDAPAAITIHDDEGRFLFSNRHSMLLHGYESEKEFLGINLHRLDVPESEALISERVRRIAERGEARFEVVHYHRDGSTFPLEVTAKVIEWQGRPAVLSIAVDITERKRSEQALRESEERFRAANDACLDALLLLRGERDTTGEVRDFVFVGLNRCAEEMLRMGREQLLGKRLCEVLPINREAGFFEKYKRVVDTGIPLEEEFFLPETHVPAAWYYHQVVKVGDGVFICHRDIGDRKRAEEEREKLQAQLLHAQKMESVGRLAGGVAHDFNNMLQTILGTAELLAASTAPDDPRRADLDDIIGAARRSADLTRQLLAFARRQTIAPRVLDLNDTIANMLKMLRRLIGEDIDLLWKPAADLWPVKMDPSQIDQLLANLTVNARDAISGGGTVRIETSKAVLAAADCLGHANAVPGDCVVLTVADTGCGMDAETQACIFEPFFTTKGEGKGTGLGLATVYGIVRQNNGLIDVTSDVGKGTTFRIYLPRHAVTAAVEGVAAEADNATVLTGTGTVLLVEDEAPLLRLATRLLTGLGYTVLPAAGPQEALRIAAAHQRPIDLLLTDVVMPAMSGRELRDRLLTARPQLKCLFMSGYTADAIAHRGVLDEGLHFIQKPFSQAAIAAKLRDVLDGERRSP